MGVVYVNSVLGQPCQASSVAWRQPTPRTEDDATNLGVRHDGVILARRCFRHALVLDRSLHLKEQDVGPNDEDGDGDVEHAPKDQARLRERCPVYIDTETHAQNAR